MGLQTRPGRLWRAILRVMNVSANSRVTKTQEMVYEMRVGDVMTRKVITVRPTDLMSRLRSIFKDNRISGVAVVDGDRLAGLVSLEDFIKWMADREQDCAVEKKMTMRVETLYEDEPLVAAIGKFERTGLGRFPVLQRQPKRLVGIVTKGDIIEGLLKKFEIDDHQGESVSTRPSDVVGGVEADRAALLCQYEVKGQDIQRAGGCSSRLKKTLLRLGLPPDLVRRVAIASYEAEMNVVVFTEGGSLRAKVEPAQVLLEVEDSGPGIADLQKALQPGYSTAPEWVRELGFGAGMGLTNIQKNSDRFDIQSELGVGTVLKVAFLANGMTDATG